MCRVFILLVLCGLTASTVGQTRAPFIEIPAEKLRNEFSTRHGNFSLEFLYNTARAVGDAKNLVLSPITVWAVLALISEGADARTYDEIAYVARLPQNEKNMPIFHNAFLSTLKYLTVTSPTVQLEQVNSLFADAFHYIENDYADLISRIYRTKITSVDFKNTEATAKLINEHVKNVTRGRIDSIVDASTLADTQMMITSALYFKGQWKSPFNASSTLKKRPFYNAQETKIGEVNMMYNRFNYPFASIPELEGRVIELPYGVEDRLSMLIMLPDQNVTLESMFLNLLTRKLSFNKVFEELRIAKEKYSEDEVDCFLPRFKIETNERLDGILQTMGVHDLFNEKKARLDRMSRTPLYVSKIIQKAEIEVTEEGTTASAVTVAEFANRISVLRFEANKPFAYMIVEKQTNTIIFGGLYQQPSLY